MQVPMSPVRILNRAVKLYPEKTAVVDGDLRLSYAEVQKRVNQVVHAVADLEITPGGRVAVLDYNTHRYMELYFGMAASGRVLAPLNTRLSAEEYTYILIDAGAEAIVFHADFLPILEQIHSHIDSIRYFYIADGPAEADWITGTYADWIDAAADTAAGGEPADENATLNLYYTSGTTGNPKGVMLTHRNIYANALTTIISFKLGDATVWHHIAPLFHLADAFFIWSVTYQRECLARFKVPKTIQMLSELPKTGSGKILKTELRRQFSGQ